MKPFTFKTQHPHNQIRKCRNAGNGSRKGRLRPVIDISKEFIWRIYLRSTAFKNKRKSGVSSGPI